ncbi:hypothetical protein IC582_019905 [Cucumis melo]
MSSKPLKPTLKLLLGSRLMSSFAFDLAQSFLPPNLGLPRPNLVCVQYHLVLPSPDHFNHHLNKSFIGRFFRCTSHRLLYISTRRCRSHQVAPCLSTICATNYSPPLLSHKSVRYLTYSSLVSEKVRRTPKANWRHI